MNKFKEFISDNLRYMMLIGGIILLVLAVYFGFRLLTPYVNENPQTESQNTEKPTTAPETKTEKPTEKKTEKQTEPTEKPETESVKTTEAQPAATEIPETEAPQTQAPQTEAPETQAPETEPQWISMHSTAYIREAPSYDGAILDELPAGTSVMFLEDVGGWYMVEVNGMVGYVGARFFN